MYCSKSMDQPDKVANSARGQLNKENEYFPVPARAFWSLSRDGFTTTYSNLSPTWKRQALNAAGALERRSCARSPSQQLPSSSLAVKPAVVVVQWIVKLWRGLEGG